MQGALFREVTAAGYLDKVLSNESNFLIITQFNFGGIYD